MIDARSPAFGRAIDGQLPLHSFLVKRYTAGRQPAAGHMVPTGVCHAARRMAPIWGIVSQT